MKVTQVAIRPSEASNRSGRPALTPELLAASGARYSRNSEGLASILARVDPENPEKSVDSIFRMVDYGHQSIADMVPVAMFIDGISIWLAYYVWTLCPTAGGQESSTRYIRVSSEAVVPPDVLGIPAKEIPRWQTLVEGSFAAYRTALGLWERLASENPALMGIPKSLLEDSSEASAKKVQRMRRNYAFDRARYFLPVAATTNVMLVMSARGWVTLCQHLLSHPLPEAQQLGESMRNELQLSAPRMIKHATRTEAVRRAIASEFERLTAVARKQPALNAPGSNQASAAPFLSVTLPEAVTQDDLVADLAYHNNRYAPFGSSWGRTAVRFGWSGIGFAEIRDLNRHRTGTKYCPATPKGFYCALDQAPANSEALRKLPELEAFGRQAAENARCRLAAGDEAHVFWNLLGTEFPFEHLTTADKFVYEAELRTGLGAHYRYAKHVRDVLALFYRQFPATRGLILEGSAEPE